MELPPSGQGMVALMALNIFKNQEIEGRDAAYYHGMFESMKMAFADGMHYITDPRVMRMDPKALLTEEYGRKRYQSITEEAVIHTYDDPYTSGTVYLNTADKDGNMVSMIQSNYMGFGSGIVVEGTGISLQNRGADFSLQENHVNVLGPGKKTYHTIIPGMLMKEGKCKAVFGVMGGYMQPQGHFQVVSNLIDFQMNPQMALDAPRWQWVKEKSFMKMSWKILKARGMTCRWKRTDPTLAEDRSSSNWTPAPMQWGQNHEPTAILQYTKRRMRNERKYLSHGDFRHLF